MKTVTAILISLFTLNAYAGECTTHQTRRVPVGKYYQLNNSDIELVINADGSALIRDLKTLIDIHQGEQPPRILASGCLQPDGRGDWTLATEGDVCPAVAVRMFHDVEFGQNGGAEVEWLYEDAGSARRNCPNPGIDGFYSR